MTNNPNCYACLLIYLQNEVVLKYSIMAGYPEVRKTSGCSTAAIQTRI